LSPAEIAAVTVRTAVRMRERNATLRARYFGLAYYALANFQEARSSFDIKAAEYLTLMCLAITYDKLGRQADAETVLAQLRSSRGDSAAYDYAKICAQWGNTPKALKSLDIAIRLRHPDLENLKTDPLLDPLRNEPRFQTIERTLKFPD
jgi:hypothetical protein